MQSRAAAMMLAALATAVLVLLLTIPAKGEGDAPQRDKDAPRAIGPPNACIKQFGVAAVPQKEHHAYVRAVYRRKRISNTARYRIRFMQRCAASPKAASNMRYVQKQAKINRDKRKLEERRRQAVPPQLAAIAQCESHGDPRAISANGTYRGKYQFSFSTWASVGGKGDPAQASEAEQDRRAAILYRTGGPGHWPVCGR